MATDFLRIFAFPSPDTLAQVIAWRRKNQEFLQNRRRPPVPGPANGDGKTKNSCKTVATQWCPGLLAATYTTNFPMFTSPGAWGQIVAWRRISLISCDSVAGSSYEQSGQKTTCCERSKAGWENVKGDLPLKFYEDFAAFKLFFLDCGLMGALTEAPASQILIGNNIFSEYKGAFTEQYVLQQLKTVLDTSIYYLSADDSKQELDFIFQDVEKIVPVEVKAEENLRAKSMRQFCLDHPGTKGIRISMSPYREQDWMTNIPLYGAERILQAI